MDAGGPTTRSNFPGRSTCNKVALPIVSITMLASGIFAAVNGGRLVAAQFNVGKLALQRGTIYLMGGATGFVALKAVRASLRLERSHPNPGLRRREYAGKALKELAVIALAFGAVNGGRLLASHFGYGKIDFRRGLTYLGAGVGGGAVLGLVSTLLAKPGRQRDPQIERYN